MAKEWSNQHEISIMFNEWGAGFDKHDYKSEMDFYQFHVKAAVIMVMDVLFGMIIINLRLMRGQIGNGMENS